MACPDENRLLAFVEGRLSQQDIATLEAHARECSSCWVLVSDAARSRAGKTVESSGPLPRGLPSGALAAGDSVGRYTVLTLAGKGGMSEVYAAYDPELDRKIALKLLHSAGSGARAESRLLREAKAIAKVTHPNIISVYDAGDFRGRVFLAMEFIDGQTLAAWLDERPRTHDQLMPLFLAAARGLAAAHAAGLVHRDFKPQNVMVGRDGEVRVMDFGLVRQVGETDGPKEGSGADSAANDVSLTRTGEILGTPLFMAPEQFEGKLVDARADQFGYCVTLYRALFGAHPFDATNLSALMTDVVAGNVKAPPARSPVPAHLRQAVMRGLSRDPAARWPSMDALVAALAADPVRRRRRVLAIVAASLAVIGAVTFAARTSRRAESLCLGGPARLAGVWEPAGGSARDTRRDAIKNGVLASGVASAADTWSRVAAAMDTYAAGWLGMYREACEATQLRGEQSGDVLDLRMSCLDERREAMVALGDVLQRADAEVVKNAIDAANGLPPLDRCADIKQLRDALEPPRDPAARLRVDELRKQLAVVNALCDAGKRGEAAVKGAAVVAAARTLGYRPLLAESLLATGHALQVLRGRDAQATLEEAVWQGIGARRPDVAAVAASELIYVEGFLGTKYEEGERWSRLALALLDQMGRQDKRIRAWIVQSLNTVRLRQGRLTEARALASESLALKQSYLPPDHPDLAGSFNSLAEIEAALGHPEAALTITERAAALYERAYGPTSEQLAQQLNNMGEYQLLLGRDKDALQAFRRSLAMLEPHVGSDHPFIAYPLTGMGRALVALGRPAAAVKPLERALKLREAREADVALVVETRFALAQALWGSDGDASRARALAEKALADTQDEKKRAPIVAALASHATRGK